ncbi:MAG: CrcB family protein [Planctomycetes bacterium]|nr:CrcB family protein [Planctomycetota bacterium]
MREFMLVGAGGFLGASLRYGVSLAMQRWTGTFPWATLAINVLGCLLIGTLMPLVEQKPLWLVFVVPGLLGGFTTFSAFGFETWRLADGGRAVLGAVYVLASVGMGLAAVWLGRLWGLVLK